ncbi:alpha/beta hydrolase [Aspergillus mulundensis]|uniref:AB hydrolase-1 domain-containing protein n=1 Tax=Aspergillus mulundensis TaxID=1810919 RepID=A0A3D8RAC0_9EURO|nr:Uncharacterized protein DSM5745_08427 [Aspergillus mulundensis]RDW70916.1 Uncharacterized protein DSM5745_08427 [Aspergillus mulundensis]
MPPSEPPTAPSTSFAITEHVIESSHIREYARATKPSPDCLKLVVKRYTPKSNPDPRPGDLTIIGTHGSGFPKELYEPIWEELYFTLSSYGIRIRSIWLADTANQNASGLLNEKVLGDDPSWFDHSRDLLYMINQFKNDMPQPIVGIGHSYGSGQLALLSLMHPRLFTSLILIEPVIEKDIYTGVGPELVRYALARKNGWASYEEAETHFKKLFKKWDARVLELWMKYGLKKTPPSSTSNTDTNTASSLTLKTHPYQEVNQYLRANYEHKKPACGDADHADIVGPDHTIAPFYRAEPLLLWRMLPHIRPSVLYFFGGASPSSTPAKRNEKLERTGVGVGGSGGYKIGRVKEVTIEGGTHQLPFEEVSRIAKESAGWLRGEIERWKEDDERVKKSWEVEPGNRVKDWHAPLKESLRKN